MKQSYLFFFVITVFAVKTVFPQHSYKTLTLEEIWSSGKFSAKVIYGLNSMNDGESYTVLENQKEIVKYSYTTGKKTGTVFNLSDIQENNNLSTIDDYVFSHDESKILISSDGESLYRYSSFSYYYVYDLKTKKMIPVCAEGKQRLAELSPTGDKVAYMKENNLYIKDLAGGTTTQITSDGKINTILNGAPDWVYEEEFGFSRAFFWSPDGKKIAYIRFDETHVKEFFMTIYGKLYPEQYIFKYPKAGEANSAVSVHVYDILSGKTLTMNTGDEKDFYIPHIQWTKNPNTLCITWLNRLQNKMKLLFADATTGVSRVALTEENKYFVDVYNDLTFLNDGKHFIWTSERSQWKHIYLFDMNGNIVNQVTSGNWVVTSFLGVDEKNSLVYYISTEESPIERYIYSVKLDGAGKKKLSQRKGSNSAEFSRNYTYYINTFSDANTPYYITVNKSDGKEIRVLEDNNKLNTIIKDYGFSKMEFFDFISSSGEKLYYWMIKPPDFNPEKKYPVFMTVYGGPGNQTVMNEWGRQTFIWYQLLAQNGYVIVSVDNRGTDNRGENFSKSTYMHMGKLESDDMIESARYFGSMSFIDKNRIGIEGWSYGGTMAALCLLRGNMVFKAAIAVAPVTNWRYYDNIYSERFMRTPQENPHGYDDYSPINHVDSLKGKLLLVHGTGDDNVHVQNSMDFISALVNANKQFDMFLYPNKNHGIYGGYTRLHLFLKMTNFILKNI